MKLKETALLQMPYFLELKNIQIKFQIDYQDVAISDWNLESVQNNNKLENSKSEEDNSLKLPKKFPKFFVSIVKKYSFIVKTFKDLKLLECEKIS